MAEHCTHTHHKEKEAFCIPPKVGVAHPFPGICADHEHDDKIIISKENLAHQGHGEYVKDIVIFDIHVQAVGCGDHKEHTHDHDEVGIVQEHAHGSGCDHGGEGRWVSQSHEHKHGHCKICEADVAENEDMCFLCRIMPRNKKEEDMPVASQLHMC